MRKYDFSDELMARFYDGNTTAAETMMILNAAKEDPELKKEIDFMTSFPRDLMDIQVSREEAKSAKEVSLPYEEPYEEPCFMVAKKPYRDEPQVAYLPMWRLAAQSREYGHNMKASNDCVVRCEHYILQLFNINTSVETLTELSRRKEWLKEGGTPLHHIGRLLSEFHRLSVVRRYDCQLDDISQELNSGCKVIAVINADKLYGSNVKRSNPNHAVVILSIGKQNVCIFDPQQALKETHPIANFMFAWQDSHYYIVSVTKRGMRKYEPHPIDASHFQLPDNLKELLEAIAENSHEVWARQRISEGWEYGEKRDDEKKKHPDLVPYSDLTESEKEYDRKMARETLMLVLRLGYKISKEE